MSLIPRRRRRSKDATMTVVEHLTELRKRLFISLAAVGVGSIVGFVFFQRILGFLVKPYRDAVEAIGAKAEGVAGGRLVFTGPVEGFIVFLKVGVFAGFLLALPVVLWEVWRFVTPGLRPRERRLGILFVLASVVLFALGTAFAFFILPPGLRWLLGFTGSDLVPLLTADRYLGFLIFLILAFGLSFEFPIVLVFLAAARIISTPQLRRWRRGMYMGTAVFAAIITPTQDPYTMLAMWVPLLLMYEGSILIAKLMKR